MVRNSKRTAGTNVLTIVVTLVGLASSAPPIAHAREGGSPLSGRYLVTSNGEWAKINDVRRDQATVRQVWTVTSTCVDSTECVGQVTSSQGWSADLRYGGASWVVMRVVPDWVPCPDGSAAPGTQRFTFWGVDPAGQTDDGNTDLLAGNDTTLTPSGGCGVNQPVVVAFPLRLQRINE